MVDTAVWKGIGWSGSITTRFPCKDCRYISGEVVKSCSSGWMSDVRKFLAMAHSGAVVVRKSAVIPAGFCTSKQRENSIRQCMDKKGMVCDGFKKVSDDQNLFRPRKGR
jgi:hypothetical protein